MTLQIALPMRFRWPQWRTGAPAFIISIFIILLGALIILPVILILLTSFMVQPEIFVGDRIWGLGNWVSAFQEPRIFRALWNTFLVWGLTMIISMPVSVVIAWVLARTKVPCSHGLEFMFWVAYIIPGAVIGWILLLDPQIGIINVLIREVFTDLTEGPFNIFSVGGIVWVHLMGNGIALKVMLLTPAFRNMDVSLEEAARVGGSSSIRTMLRVTLPLMAAPITLVFALQLVKIFQSFETELLLGAPWGFYVYSTLIYDLVRNMEPPHYGEAAVLASLTLLIIAMVIPFQQWMLSRKKYTTITGTYKAGLIDLGSWKWIVFALLAALHFVLTVIQLASLVVGSFMTPLGLFPDQAGVHAGTLAIRVQRQPVHHRAQDHADARGQHRCRQSHPVRDHRLYPGAHAVAGQGAARQYHLVLRGHAGNAGRARAVDAVPRHARLERALRHHLGDAAGCHPAGQGDRHQYPQG